MQQRWKVGQVSITKVVEIEAASSARWLLPQATRESLLQVPWLQPHFCNAEGRVIMSVHMFVIEADGMRIAVDTCVGNDKRRSIPAWDARQGPFLSDLERAGFATDSIDRVLCTSPTLKPGEICIVRGTYTLASRDAADLSFYITATKGSGISDVDRRQVLSVKRGSGTFELRHGLSEGWPHLSFYAGGGSIGGVYFGQGESLLKVIPWKKANS